MTNSRKARIRRQRQRRALLTMALVLVTAFACIGGTIAWLTDNTDPVTNTFTVGDIDITLTETPNQEDGSWSAQLIPGEEYPKNPVVAVDGSKTNVDVYLFVKFEEINNPSMYLTYTSTLNGENGWTKVEGETNVWYREVEVDDATKSWHLLDGDKVTVKSDLLKAGSTGDVVMPAANATPSLKYTAYAVQSENLTVEAAWAEVKP